MSLQWVLGPSIHREQIGESLIGKLVNQKLAIMGDCNLTQIPYFSHADVQINSFQRATFIILEGC